MAYTVQERIDKAKSLGIIVDKEYEFVLGIVSFRISTRGYAEATFRDGNWKKTVKLHHFIVGTPFDGFVVDHINRNPLDNRLENLRIITPTENQLNCARQDNAQCIYTNASGTFFVRMRRNKEVIHLGTYDTMQEAIKVRDQWREVQLTEN